MTRLDEIRAKWWNGDYLTESPGSVGATGQALIDKIAIATYEMADAMLIARTKTTNKKEG